MSIDSYRAYLSSHKSSTSNHSERFKKDLQNMSDRVFEVSSNYKIIKHKTLVNTEILSTSTPVWTDVGVRLISPFKIERLSVLKDDFIKIIFKDFNYNVNLGDIFEFNDYRWMVVNTSSNASVTKSALVQRCNAVLKFVESAPLNENIIIIDAVSSKYSMNELRDGQFIKLPNNKLEVWIPNDVHGRKIQWTNRGGTRFLLNNPYQNWNVVSYDNISLNRTTLKGSESHGIIKLELELSSINAGMDDLENGVAWQDYF